MSNSQHKALKVAFISVFAFLVILYSTRLRADSGVCGGQTINLPFTDVAGNLFFCQIAEAYLSGLTYGTDATHYSPSEVVPRGQMAAFITRTQDSILRRGSLRAALNMWATPKTVGSGAITGVGCFPTDVASDGVDLWVANPQHNGFCGVGTVSRIAQAMAEESKPGQTRTARRAFVLLAGGSGLPDALRPLTVPCIVSIRSCQRATAPWGQGI